MRKIFGIAAFLLLFCVVVIPNSLPRITAALLVICGVLSLVLIKPLNCIPRLIRFYVASAGVSLIYLIVGQIQGAPTEAASQVLIIYLISPLLWMLVAVALFLTVSEEEFVRWLQLFCLLALGSIALYFVLFQAGGAEAVQFFIANANLNLNDGYVGATMFVYGSLIFLSAGFFAAPGIIKNPLLRVLVLLLLPVAVATSGRGALMVSVPMGVLIGAWLRASRPPQNFGIFGLLTTSSFLMVTQGFVILLLAAIYYDLDLNLILNKLLDEIWAFGGEERSSQARFLLDGTLSNFGLGSGHGIGVDYVRSEMFPWRYEVVSLATLYRVGVLGMLIYIAPFVVYFLSVFSMKKAGELNLFDVFMFSGLVASMFAANTNPYIEAFSFQWMFIFPLVLMEIRRRKLLAIHGARVRLAFNWDR